MFKRIIKELNNFRSLDEMCVVTTKNKVQGKFKDRGTACLFVEYPSNHADNMYRVLNLKTVQVIKARDVIWLNNCYGDWLMKKNENEIYDDK